MIRESFIAAMLSIALFSFEHLIGGFVAAVFAVLLSWGDR